MSIKKFSMMLLSAMSLAAMLSGCGSSSKEGSNNLGGVARVADEATCRTCHAATIDPVSGTGIVADFLGTGSLNSPPIASVHFTDSRVGCQGCHGGGAQHNGVGPIPFPNPLTANRCIICHTAGGLASTSADLAPLFEVAKAGWVVNGCAYCHTASRIGSVHGALVTTTEDCVLCHAVAAPQHGTNLVNDNNGVRAITGEFAKWSHHVTGVTLNSAHCAACHLEGIAGADGLIHIDKTKHMVDNKTHLRDTTLNTDADFAWDPAAPNHSGMDNFCMSCHDANGAVSPMSVQIQLFINSNGLTATGKTASASNPFGDTISNRYDKMQRPAVVDASSQFNTTAPNVGNNSHHAVKGPRYSGRTRAAGPRQIASPATFANNSSQLLQGVRSTMFDAGNLNQLYTPLENAGGETAPRTGAATLGDDSTLHCGDCHTVGQWNVASSTTVGTSTTANGSDTPVAIGAHGSNNEYLLRNSIGTDQRHTQNAFLVGNATGTVINPFTGVAIPNGVVVYTNPNGAFLVCYNCHNYNKYGSIFLASGVVGGHAGEYDGNLNPVNPPGQAGRCNGIGNTLPFNGYTTGTATNGTQFVSRFNGPISRYAAIPAFAPGFPLNGTPPVGEQNPDFGDIFGIQCANCHNSGTGNAYGGIHGSAKNQNTVTQTVNPAVTGGAYIDGMGNTTKIERFMPGLGNAMHVPGTLGGFIGGVTVNSTTAVPYPYTTGGISNDTNWEQKHFQQTAATVINNTTGAVTGVVAAGAGCYTLGANLDAATAALRGPSVTGAGGPATVLFDTWGGCDDHNHRQGDTTHGFIKKIVRPVTY
ncbi:MAG: hypothetical protein JJE30_00145 [Desulfuromonadales bacterium]|nr:hypothetical protein [Desulfuromonadales bacterium]